MKSFLVSLLLIFAFNSYPQADLDIILTFITDEPPGDTWILHFGLDSTATNGIDPWLGEVTYPPDACGGWGFSSCISFLLPPPPFGLDAGPRDYRYGVSPYSGQVEHRLGISLGDSTTQAEMFWDFPEGVSVHLEDEFGGIIFELDIQGSGSFVFTDSIPIIHRIVMIAEYNNVVPVELTSFTASVLQNEKTVILNWSTATETNNQGFEIQRKQSRDRSQESEWERISFVPGFGTTTETKSYSFIDENVSTGTYKYRLKQIDFDGSFEFSNEIEVVVDLTPKEFVLYQNYPNPFNPSTVIKYEIPNVETTRRVVFTTLKVYDVLGNEIAILVNEEKQPGVYEVEFNSDGLSSGIYFYQLTSGNFTSTKKFVLMK